MRKNNISVPEEFMEYVASLSDQQVQLLLELERQRKPERLEVSSEEREKIEEILSVFQEYIDGHYYFDIIYSKKFGYYRPDIDGEHVQFDTADDLMNCLIDEFYLDVRDLKMGGEHRFGEMRTEEEKELRKRITPYIERLSNKEHYFDILDTYIECY